MNSAIHVCRTEHLILLGIQVACISIILLGLRGGAVDMNRPASAVYTGSIPGPGRFHMPQGH